MAVPNIKTVEYFIQHPCKSGVDHTNETEFNKFTHHNGRVQTLILVLFEQNKPLQPLNATNEDNSIQLVVSLTIS